MAMAKCKECGHEVNTSAQSCPNCGASLKKKNSNYLGFFVFLIFIFIVIGILNGSFYRSPSKPSSGLTLPSFGEQIVTYDEYQRIQDGMSYREVVAIIGVGGEEISRVHMDGVPGVMESIDTVMYQWVNSNGSNMNAMFQNDKLISKAQFGLP